MREEEVSKGLQALVEGVQSYAANGMRKTEAMQEVYLEGNGSLYAQLEQEQLRDYFKSVSLKFYLATLHLEQLWILSHTSRGEVLQALENSLDRLEWSSDEELLGSFALEGFLMQAWAFVYLYMHYICILLHSRYEGSMTKALFFKRLAKTRKEPFAQKAREVEEYFKTRVFGSPGTAAFVSNDWGTLLESLRTKVTHRDRLRPSREGAEELAGGVLIDWPTLRGQTYDRFCQEMQNGMFSLIEDVSPILYEVEWKPGPYREDLWQ